MPCNGDYLNATQKEIQVSNLFYVRDELNGFPIEPSKWSQGYHPAVYNKPLSDEAINAVMIDVCFRLQQRDVSTLSLEAQIWWRDHQRADKERIEREIAEKRTWEEKQAALAKLTLYERQLLGF